MEMEMEGDEGMMETEEEWGTAPVASSSGPAGNSEEKSEEWGVGLRSPMVSDESGALDDIFDPARFPSSAGTLYEKVAAGAFESILDEKNSANAQQQQQMVEEVVTCLPYLVRVALANPAHSILFQKLHALPQLNSVLAYLALDIDAVEDPLEAELQRKRKTGSTNPAEGSLVFQYGEGLVSEFETGSEEVKMRLFLSELHNVMDHVRLANASKSRGATRSFPAYHSEIFGDELYLEELGFILPIAMLRLRRAPLSLEAVIEALLCVDLGGRLLRILFFNMPALRDEILLTLIKCAAAAPHLVTEVLLDLCSLSATIALFVRTWVMQQHQLPGLALKLTITHIKDEVAFLSGLLHDHKWIDSYFSEQQSVPGSPVILLRARLLTMVVEFDGSISGRSTLPAQQRIRLTALIKLYCGLVGLLKLKLEGEEMNAILSLLTKVKDERIAKLGLCWLLACEGLLRHCSKEAVVVCLSSLLKSGHCLEMLSLLAIHFHTNQISSAIELIRETLGLTVAIHSESLNQIAAVFTEDLFTEEVVAKEAVALAVRPKLSDKDTKSFAVMCVYHLLKNKIFSKHRVDVGEWVWSQITQADEPIHYLLPALIEEWVKSILAPTTSFCMKRPLEEQIVAVFSASAAATKRKRKEKDASSPAAAAQLGTPVDELTSQERASQVLALYFALYYNEEVLRQSIDDRSRSGQRAVFSPGKAGKGNTVRAYSGELMESLPVKALLSHARERSADTYSNIYPPLLNLVISQFPGLLTVVNMLNEEEQKSSTIKEFLTIPHFNFVDANMRPTDDESSSPLAQEKPVAPEHAVVKSAFESVLTAPIQTLFMLTQLNRLSASALQAYTDLLIFTLLPRLLEDDVQHRVRVRFVELWELLHTLTPFESALKSINAISPPSGMTTAMDFPSASAHKSQRRGVSHYSHMDVVMDPLLVFRCDPRLFRIPPLFKMLLQILDTYLTESHKYINTLLSVEPATGNADKGARHEELVTLLHAQDTAVVQLLLEVCIDRDNSPIKGPMEEVRIQSCTFIHQMFCETPQLMKLVHLQGYPDELLPVTVYGIPSIHVALEFLPELLNQPQPERLVFAIKLAGFLIEKYTLPKCIDLARMVLQKIHSTTVASDDPRTFLMETLPSLAKIATTFPAQLAEDTVSLLQEVSTIAGRSAAVGGVAVAHPQLHAQIQATFAALAARAIDPMA